MAQHAMVEGRPAVGKEVLEAPRKSDVARRLFVDRQRLPPQPVPTAPVEQGGMRTTRNQVRVQDRMYLFLIRVRCRTTWFRRATRRRRRSVSGSGVQTSGRKPDACRLAR